MVDQLKGASEALLPEEREKLLTEISGKIGKDLFDVWYILHVGENPNFDSAEEQALNTMTVQELLESAKKEGPFNEVLLTLKDRIGGAPLEVGKLLTDEEILEYQKNKGTFQLIRELIKSRLNFLAENQGRSIVNPHNQAKSVQLPKEDFIKRQIYFLLAARLINAKELPALSQNQALHEIITALFNDGQDKFYDRIVFVRKALADYGLEAHNHVPLDLSSRVSDIPDSMSPEVIIGDPGKARTIASAVTQAIASAEPTLSKNGTQLIPVFPGQPLSRAQIGQLPTLIGQSASPSDAPSAQPAPPSIVYDDALSAPTSSTSPASLPSLSRLPRPPHVPSDLIRPASAEAVLPSLRRGADTIFGGLENKENPNILDLPVAALEDGNGNLIETIPLYSWLNFDQDHGVQYLYIGSAPVCDIQIPDHNLPAVHAVISIVSDKKTPGKSCVIAKAYNGAIGVKNSKKLITAKEEVTSFDDTFIIAPTIHDPDAPRFLLKISETGQVFKNQLKSYFTAKLNHLFAARSDAYLEGGSESETVRQLDEKIKEIFNFSETYKLGLLTEGDLKKRFKESEKAFHEEIAKRKDEKKAEFWLKQDADIAREVDELCRKDARLAAKNRRCAAENLKGLHLTSVEDPEKCQIVYRGPVMIVTYGDTHIDMTKDLDLTESSDHEEIREIVMRSLPPVSSASQKESAEKLLRKRTIFPFCAPILLNHYRFGANPACFAEFDKTSARVAPFMGELNYDICKESTKTGRIGRISVKMLDPGTSIRHKNTPDYTQLGYGLNEFDEHEWVRLGPYRLTVERDHGYTADALFHEAEWHIMEMLEVIMNTDDTNEEYDHQAYSNIEAVLKQTDLPPAYKKRLIESCVTSYSKDLEKLWERICDWSPADLKPDAKLFHPVIMTSKLNESGETFLPNFGIHHDHLRGQAIRRVQRYSDICTAATRKIPWLARKAEKYPSLEKLDKRIADQKKEHERNLKDVQWAAVEIARFIEHGIATFDDLESLRGNSYLEKIKTILKVRALIKELGTADQNRCVQIYGELISGKDYGKLTVGDFLGEDEIHIYRQEEDFKRLNKEWPIYGDSIAGKPVNVKDMSLYKDLGLSYAASNKTGLLVLIGQKMAYHLYHGLPKKISAEEKQHDLNLLQFLLKNQLASSYDIAVKSNREVNYAQVGEDAKAIEDNISLYVERVANSLRRQQLERAEEKRLYQERKNLLHDFEQQNIQRFNQAKKVIEAIISARTNMDTESLDKLMEAAELIGSKDLEAYFKAYWGGKVEDREDEYVLEEEGSLQRKIVVSSRSTLKNWDDIKQEAGDLLLTNAKACAYEAFDSGTDAYYLSLLLNEAIEEKKLFTWTDIDSTPENIKHGVLLEQYGRFEQQVLTGDFDDFDFMDETYIANITDPEMAEIHRSRMLITATRKMKILAEKIRKNDDAGYCRMVAQEILEKYPQLKLNILPADFALLQ